MLHESNIHLEFNINIQRFELRFIECLSIEALVVIQIVSVNIHYIIERNGINAGDVHMMQRESFQNAIVLAIIRALTFKRQRAINVQTTQEVYILSYRMEKNWGFKNLNQNIDFPGLYPNCVCENSHHIYDKSNKQCNIPCESGIHSYPNCKCVNPLDEYVNKTTGKCVPYARPGRPCPPAAIGISPKCHCLQEGHYFIPSYGWGCFNKHSVDFIDRIGCAGQFCDDPFEQSIDPKLLLSLVG